MIVTILGKRWRLEFVPMRGADGQCDPPTLRRKAIRIRRGLLRHPQALLEVLLHEALHAADWSKDEAWTEDVAADVARLIWSQGYRRVEDAKTKTGAGQ